MPQALSSALARALALEQQLDQRATETRAWAETGGRPRGRTSPVFGTPEMPGPMKFPSFWEDHFNGKEIQTLGEEPNWV